MAGRELGFLKPAGLSLREQLARKTLRNLRLQGHSYVELREDGKRYIFFCTLCLAPCYSDAVLYDHLRGNLHKERYAAAKITLIGPNPWPFNDGILFFHITDEEDKAEPVSCNSVMNSMGGEENAHELAVVVHGDKTHTNGHAGNGSCSKGDSGLDDEDAGGCRGGYDMVIPGVMGKEEVSDLRVRLMGCGQISARFYERKGGSIGVQKIWCEWLGQRGNTVEFDNVLSTNEFAIVNFGYYYDLGKQGLFDDIRSMLPPPGDDFAVQGHSDRKRKLSSDAEVSESPSSQYDSSGEDSHASSTATSRMVLDHYDDQLVQARIISNKALRRELRKQQRLASERMCDICQHKMLPGKDVATLLNLKTGRLACSSRNVHGAFHVFHTSCLIHWLLLCEFEILTNRPAIPPTRRRSKRKSTKATNLGKEFEPRKTRLSHNQIRQKGVVGSRKEEIRSIFCPDCQGSGGNTEGDKLESPTVPLSEIFKYKIKMSDARRAWMKSPEHLQNCSTGLAFPQLADDIQEKVSSMKLLRVYRAEEEGWVHSC